MATTRIVTVRGIIYQHNKVFGVRHRASDGTVADYWAIPGGKLDPGELLTDGLHREFIEETGVAPVIGRLLFMQQFRDKKDESREYLEFFYHVTNAADYQTIELANTTHGFSEIGEYGFVDPARVTFLPASIRDLDLAALVAGTQPPVLLNNFNEQTL